MKISYNWIKDFVSIDVSPRDLADKLTMAGLAVDAVEPFSKDHVLEFDLTSNRPDCLSHLGIAREAAAAFALSDLTMPEVTIGEATIATSDLASVEILNPELCPRYSARLIRGVRIGPSPAWLIERLEAMGQRSVNNVADITNYVMLEMGQPLHAFDFNNLHGRRIVVRTARPGERITTLDGEQRELTGEMLVIADGERPVALAGIKGGEDSGINDETTDVLLEAAYFTPSQVRQTSKALALSTEASYRFERGMDPDIVAVASNRAASMIAEIAGGEVLRGLLDVYPGKDSLRAARKPIIFRRSRYIALTGLDLELSEAERILHRLGFEVESQVDLEQLKVIAPSWRIDISLEEDIIEEVARISGYDKLRNSLPGNAGAGAYLEGEDGRRLARRALAALGYHEAINFSFVNSGLDERVNDLSTDARLGLLNPIDETQAHMRTTLLAGLLNSLEHNFNYGSRNVRLFEIGKCFIGKGEDKPVEIERLALIATGARNEADWQASSSKLDFYDIKGAVESVTEILGLPALEFSQTESISFLHPGRAAQLSLAGKQVGRIGQLHPRLGADYKFKQPVFVAELDLGVLLLLNKLESRYRPLPKFPTVVRDQALLIDSTLSFSVIDAAVAALKIPELVNLRIFDIYSGKELPSGKHSLALSFLYRADDRTLTDEEVNAAHDRIINLLKNDFGAEIR